MGPCSELVLQARSGFYFNLPNSLKFRPTLARLQSSLTLSFAQTFFPPRRLTEFSKTLLSLHLFFKIFGYISKFVAGLSQRRLVFGRRAADKVANVYNYLAVLRFSSVTPYPTIVTPTIYL